MFSEDTVKVLNDLIQTSADGKKGFAEAAEEAIRPELKTLFERRSIACGTAVIELLRLVESLGGTPKDSGTVAGVVHRIRVKVKAAFGDANIAVLEEVEHAEAKATAAYAKALTATLPQQIRSVVQRQHDGAVRNHEQIRNLRSRYQVEKEAVTS
jgi:uncharacterized protein (TIGR02284 family)